MRPTRTQYLCRASSFSVYTRFMNKPWLIVILLVGLGIGATLLALNQANHTVVLTTDSIVYVDTARHIARGQGVTTSILTFDSTRLPNPQTQYPPLYPMVMSPLIYFGVEPILAGRIVSAVSFGLVVVLLGLWAWRLAGPLTGMAAAALVTTLPAITSIAAAVWADSLYALIVTGLAWLGYELSQRPDGRLRWFLFGALAGLGLLDKYFGILLLGIIAVTVLLTIRRGQPLFAVVQRFGLALAGLALFIVPLLLRNVALDRPIGGADRTLSSQPLLDIIRDAIVTLGRDVTANVLWIGVLTVTVAAVVLLLRQPAQRQQLLLLTPIALMFVVYVLGLVAARFFIDTDRIHTRFAMPVYPLAVLLCVTIFSWAVKTFDRRAAIIMLSALTIAAVAWSVKTYDFTSPGYTPKPSARTKLIAELTTDRDLIIGDRAREYNLFLGRAVIQLHGKAEATRLTLELLKTLKQRWDKKFDRLVLALSPNAGSLNYGPFVAVASQNDLQSPSLQLLKRDTQLKIYQVD